MPATGNSPFEDEFTPVITGVLDCYKIRPPDRESFMQTRETTFEKVVEEGVVEAGAN